MSAARPSTRARRWSPPALWLLAIFVSSSWPNPDPPDVPQGDKAVHLALYGVLAFLVGRAEPTLARVPVRALATVLTCSAIAAVDEWHQRFIPGRSPSAGDWAADSIGAALGLLLAAVVARRMARAAT